MSYLDSDLRPRPLLGALAVAMTLAACGPAPTPKPAAPPPLDLSALLPADAPLTVALRPDAVLQQAAGMGLLSSAEVQHPTERLRGLGFDPARPLWAAARTGPVLAVLRAAEDTERLLADAPPALDPRFAPPDPFARWLEAQPLPPAWLHVRLVGPARPLNKGEPGPEAHLQATEGALAVVGAADPTETLAATLGCEIAAAEAIQTALGADRPTVYRLLDAPLPMAVAVRRAADTLVVDVLWDRDLGEGALCAALARIDTEPPPTPLGPLVDDGLLALRAEHAGIADWDRVAGEVRAMQRVLGQGPMPADALDRLRAARAEARRVEELLAPVARLLGDTVVSLVRTDGRLRARVMGRALTDKLAALADGVAPADHGSLSSSLGAEPGGVVALALAPEALSRVLGPLVDAPRTTPGEHVAAVERCGAVCLPALWSVLAHAADLPATVAAQTAQAPLATALAETTGAAVMWTPDGLAAAVGHRPPATLERAAWAPITDAAGLEARWIVGDRAVLVVGRSDAAEAMAAAARAPATTDAAALRFTVVDPPLPGGAGLRLEGAVSFERAGVVIDAVVDRPPPAEAPPGG